MAPVITPLAPANAHPRSVIDPGMVFELHFGRHSAGSWQCFTYVCSFLSGIGLDTSKSLKGISNLLINYKYRMQFC